MNPDIHVEGLTLAVGPGATAEIERHKVIERDRG
jgi:hypothetical protein